MPETGFISFLPPDQRKELETLFFFNPEQSRFSEEIEQAVSLFGDPMIQENPQGITITLPKFPEAQCLFAQGKVKKHLLAAVIYFRSEPDELEALHVAVRKKGIQPYEPAEVLSDCFKTLIQIAKQIKGVKKVILPYGRGSIHISPSKQKQL